MGEGRLRQQQGRGCGLADLDPEAGGCRVLWRRNHGDGGAVCGVCGQAGGETEEVIRTAAGRYGRAIQGKMNSDRGVVVLIRLPHEIRDN